MRIVIAMTMALALVVSPLAASAGTLSAAVTAGQAATVGNAANLGADARSSAQADQFGESQSLTDGEKQGYGCLASGTAALLATVVANPNEMIMVIAGGTLFPTTPVGMGVAIMGTVFASVCAVGAIATPAVVRTWNQLGL